MRNGKARKEIYLSSDEQKFLDHASKFTGLDKTNTMRLLIHLGYQQLINSPHNAVSGNHRGAPLYKNENPTGNFKLKRNLTR